MDRNTGYSYRPSGPAANAPAPGAYRPSGPAANVNTNAGGYRPSNPVNTTSNHSSMAASHAADRNTTRSYRPTVPSNNSRSHSNYSSHPPPLPPPAPMGAVPPPQYQQQQYQQQPSQGWRQTTDSSKTAQANRETAYTNDYRYTQDIADVNRQTAYTYRSENTDPNRMTTNTWRSTQQPSDPNRMTTNTWRSTTTDLNRLTTRTYRKKKPRGRSSRFSMLSTDLFMGITPAVPEPPSIRVPTYYQGFNNKSRKSRFSKYLSVNGPVWRPSGSESQTNLQHLGDIEEEGEGWGPGGEEGDFDEDEWEDEEPFSIYTPFQKKLIVIGNAFIAFVASLTVQMYMPALNVLALDFEVSATSINLTVTVFLIFQGISPLIFSGFTDVYGRRPGYIVCFVVYVAANVALALSDSYKLMLGLRCLQSMGTSVMMNLSQAAVADIVTSAERPQFIGITSIPTILGPSLGPVIGGALLESLRWRSIFWFLAIYASLTFFILIVCMPETCRKIVGDGSVRPGRGYYTVVQSVQIAREKETPVQNMVSRDEARAGDAGKTGPMMALSTLFSSVKLFAKLQLVLLITGGGLAFGAVYAVSTAAPKIFSDEYGLTEVQVGLMYLPMAVGSIAAVLVVGPAMNYTYAYYARQAGINPDKGGRLDLDHFEIERARLLPALPLLVLGAIVIAGSGWAFYARAHLAVICVLIFFFGAAIVGVNNAVQVLIVDIFYDQAGAALAAFNFMKCAFGAASSAMVKPLIDEIGFGWTFTAFGGTYILIIPILLLVMWRGKKWRPVP